MIEKLKQRIKSLKESKEELVRQLIACRKELNNAHQNLGQTLYLYEESQVLENQMAALEKKLNEARQELHVLTGK